MSILSNVWRATEHVGAAAAAAAACALSAELDRLGSYLFDVALDRLGAVDGDDGEPFAFKADGVNYTTHLTLVADEKADEDDMTVRLLDAMDRHPAGRGRDEAGD